MAPNLLQHIIGRMEKKMETLGISIRTMEKEIETADLILSRRDSFGAILE